MDRTVFEIDPNIRRAETLSTRFYAEEEYFEASKERIFARSWQLIGRAEEVDNLLPVTLLGGFLDEPVLISREGGELYCLSNVCTHRGNILVEKACRARGIRCGYHGRRFAPDGKFLSMPEFEEAENFPSEKDDLPRLPLGVWEDFLFASIDPVAPLAEFIGEMESVIKGFEFEKLRFKSARDYEVRAHWALYCENYLEGFHIPFVHQSLNEEIDYGSYATEVFRFSSLQTAFESGQRPAPGGQSEPRASAESVPRAVASGSLQPTIREMATAFSSDRAAYYFFIFPNLMFNFYPWGLSVNIVRPLAPDLSKITFLTYVSDESKLETGAGADLHRVEMEDERVVENVQKGIRSRFYDRGRYSPTRERGTHHFHRLIAEFMR
ncbi:MAG: aromatic ring-hydroxylating dioxygenase subunit alpha [Pyrinomonadaceae bacterium]